MNPIRRLSLFVAAVAAVFTACAPFQGAKLRAAAAQDTLSRTRDSLFIARQRILALDSLIVPLTRSTPDSFLVAFETTRGRFDVMVRSEWAPVGVDRFYDLVRRRFYDNVVVFRIVKGFVAQFGISPDPVVSAAWSARRIADDRPRESNTRGRLSFASAGPNTRTTQLFINFADNRRLDADATSGYPPIGEVVAGMEVVDSLYAEYGGAPANAQDSIQRQGNRFLVRAYPKLDVIRTARIINEWRARPER